MKHKINLRNKAPHHKDGGDKYKTIAVRLEQGTYDYLVSLGKPAEKAAWLLDRCRAERLSWKAIDDVKESI